MKSWKIKLTSRKFLMVVAGVLVALFNRLFGWNLDETTVFSAEALVVAYVFGESYVDSKAIKRYEARLKQKLLSRKFLVAAIGFIVTLLNHVFGWGLDADALVQIVSGIVAYIIGESYVDGRAKPQM